MDWMWKLFGFLIKNVSWHLCEIYTVQCVYGFDLRASRAARREEKE